MLGITSAMLWRNKTVSCEGIRSFEAMRKAQLDFFQTQDRLYWQQFEKEILRAREENYRLQRFFAAHIQAVRRRMLFIFRFFINRLLTLVYVNTGSRVCRVAPQVARHRGAAGAAPTDDGRWQWGQFRSRPRTDGPALADRVRDGL